MLHSIDPATCGPNGAAMCKAVEACVHCGYCLPTCPTYVASGEEMNSPRGRILLMRHVLEGQLRAEQVRPYIDQCLGCLSCATACPSGVLYGELLGPYRAWAEASSSRPWRERLRRRLLLALVPHPARFRLGVAAGRLGRVFSGLLPKDLRAMMELAPATVPARYDPPPLTPAKGRRRARVALLTGCAQQVLAPDINRATIRVLSENGVEVVVPGGQACCGAMALHIGARAEALASARRNLAAFPKDVDAVVTNAAGCGSGLHEYRHLFHGEPDAPEAEALAGRATDICVFLDRLGLATPARSVRPRKIAYHDACHLAHAQGVRAAPRRLLAAIPGLELVEPAEWELCCGSAGTYNIEQPGNAAVLGRRKAGNLLATGAEVIATGNIGCLVQIRAHLRLLGRDLPIVHTVQLLAEAY